MYCVLCAVYCTGSQLKHTHTHITGLHSTSTATYTQHSHIHTAHAKRIIFMRDGILVSEVSVEQLFAACHLPGNNCDTMKVLCLERYVTTGPVGSESKMPFWSKENYSHGLHMNPSTRVPSVWYHCGRVVNSDLLL